MYIHTYTQQTHAHSSTNLHAHTHKQTHTHTHSPTNSHTCTHEVVTWLCFRISFKCIRCSQSFSSAALLSSHARTCLTRYWLARWKCVCITVCMHTFVYMCVCVCLHTFAHVCVWMCTCMWVHVYTLYTFLCMVVHNCVLCVKILHWYIIHNLYSGLVYHKKMFLAINLLSHIW